jgi:hypothetical protein
VKRAVPPRRTGGTAVRAHCGRERSSTVKIDENLLLRLFIVETALVGVIAAIIPLFA